MANLSWFALYVKSRHEKHVSTILQGKGYEIFLPTYTHRVKYSKTFELPLFPSYVFCRLDPQTPLPIISTPGVFSIISNAEGPAPISEHELDGLRRMLQATSMPTVWPYVAPGDEIVIESGPFEGVRGVVVDVSDGRWLVISINLLQRSVAVRLERESLAMKVDLPSGSKYRVTRHDALRRQTTRACNRARHFA